MAWIKRNIWIVILSIVSIAVYPMAWKFSSGMNKKIKDDLQLEVQSAWSSVDVTASYSAIQVDPNVPAVQTNGVAPNAAITAYYTDLKKNQQLQLDEIVTMAEDFNRRDHAPLIEGLFPSPTGEEPALAKIAMNMLFVDGPTHPPAVYEALFESINGGSRSSGADLKDQLINMQQNQVAAKVAADDNSLVTDEEQAKMEQELVDWRLAMYRQRALDLSVYIDMQSLPAPDTDLWPQIFADQMSQPPVTWQCFLWQHDYWTISDVIAAIGRANTDESGEFMTIPDSPVKRVVSLSISAPLVPAQGMKGKDPNPGTVMDAGAQPLEADYAYSVSGRFSSPDNRLYDVRNVKLDVIVAMDKLPMFFDAITVTNFITVTDIDLESVNIAQELGSGYFYGSDYIVKAKMNLEVLLLRSWTEPHMPDDIKYLLGFPPPDAGFEDDGFGDGGG